MFEKQFAWCKEKYFQAKEKTENWVKEHPKEAKIIAGAAAVGVGVGRAFGVHAGKKKGYKKGYMQGWNTKNEQSWEHVCSMFDFDPANQYYSGDLDNPQHEKVEDVIKRLQDEDPNSKISGIWFYDDTVKPMHAPNGDLTYKI